MKAVLESFFLGERFGPPKQSVMNSRLPKWTVLPREKSLHVKYSPSVEMAIVDEWTIRTFKGKSHYKSSFLACQLSVFSASAKYRVVKFAHFSSEMILQTMKHTVIYPDSGPSLEVIALCPTVWYWRWTGLTWGEQRAREVHVVNGKMDLVSPHLKGKEPFIDRSGV
jgi:hypothetical protein